jgi:hypothetical protein
MAKQFDPRKVLKQISNALLRQFFNARGELTDVAWDKLDETDVQPVFEAWEALPVIAGQEVRLILKDVNELADERGLSALADAIAVRVPHRVEEFAAVESRSDKAMWAYLNMPAAFADASRLAQADTMATGRYWHKRNGLPKSDAALPVTDDMKQRLATELCTFYPENQGRGHHCHVEHYRRGNGNEYFFAYLEDYPDQRLVFDDAGAMKKQRERGAFDNVFVYCPADGTLESYVRGGKPVREELEALFTDSVLEAALGPEAPGSAAYALDGLVDPGVALPTDPEDGITEVRVRRLQLEVAGAPGRRIILEAGPRDARDAVHQMKRLYLNDVALPPAALRVTSASFTLTFASVDGAKPKTLTFHVGHPSSCDLKSKSDAQRAVGERCLKLWGVSRV